MKSRYLVRSVAAVVCACLLAGCSGSLDEASKTVETTPTPELPYATAPLPDNGYRAKITLPDPPAKLRAGQKETIRVKVQNVSDVPWKVRGGGDDNKYYIAAGNRWFEADGQTLITKMDGRHGLPINLKPGEETEVPLQITAPKAPGEYVLDLDLVQEQVAWFHEKGSETTKAKVTVVR